MFFPTYKKHVGIGQQPKQLVSLLRHFQIEDNSALVAVDAAEVAAKNAAAPSLARTSRRVLSLWSLVVASLVSD